jgi:hypothetical protein
VPSGLSSAQKRFFIFGTVQCIGIRLEKLKEEEVKPSRQKIERNDKTDSSILGLFVVFTKPSSSS